MRHIYDIIGYAYDADYHCPSCAERIGADKVDWKDSEGNEASALFGDFEWYLNDAYEGKRFATFGCSTCHQVIEEVELYYDKTGELKDVRVL